MYYIPDSQKNIYLKEVSALASAIRREGGIQAIATAEDIATVRERLLDWVQAAIEATIPEAKARMIRLEERQAVAEAATAPQMTAQGALQLLPTLFILSATNTLVLCTNAELSTELEKDLQLGETVRLKAQFERGGWRFVFRNVSNYGTRTLFEYLAIK
jgi:hypothetical protein